MIKDNHIAVLGLEKAITAAKKAASFTRKIEVEVETVDDAVRTAQMGVDIIMFDNMTVNEIQKAVKMLEEKGLRDNIILEASGGISIENVDKYGRTGVDVISIGRLRTHRTGLISAFGLFQGFEDSRLYRKE